MAQLPRKAKHVHIIALGSASVDTCRYVQAAVFVDIVCLHNELTTI